MCVCIILYIYIYIACVCVLLYTVYIYTLQESNMACWNMLIQSDDFPISTPFILIEGSLEVKLPTIWTDEKQRWAESEKRRRKKITKEKV